MTINVWQRSAVDEAGNIMPSATVTVRDQVTSGLVQLYSNYAGSVAIGNPFTATAEGFIRFYTESGRYQITVTSGAVTRVWEDERLGTVGSDIEYHLTSAEIAAGVTFINEAYLPGYIPRYATGGDGTSFGTRWTGWEASVSALLQLAEPFNKCIRVPAGRYAIDETVISSGGASILAEGRGVTAFYVTDPYVTAFATEYNSDGHQGVIYRGFVLSGPGIGVSGVAGIDWINTFHSAIEDLYVIGFEIGISLAKQAPSSTSSHSNMIINSLIVGNNVNILGGEQTNALTLLNSNFGGGCAIGIDLVDSVTLDIVGGGCEGATEAGVDIYTTAGRLAVGARIRCHFESNSSSGGDIRIGKNGGANVIEGVVIEGCQFTGDGTTYAPVNIVRGQGISFIGNTLNGSYINAVPIIDSSVTDYVQLANRPGDLCPNRFIGDNRDISTQNQTNKGVHSLGGGSAASGRVSVTDNQSFTVTFDNIAMIQVHDFTSGIGGLFFVTYSSATIVELGDPSTLWSTTDTDTNPGFAIFKSATSTVVTIKNYMNSTRSMAVNVFGVVTAATAPA